MHHEDRVSDRKVPFAETEATVVFDWEKGRNSVQLFMSAALFNSLSGPQGADPQPPFLFGGKAGRNHLNEEITPPPPHWDRRAIQPNHIKFRTCSALAPM
jgi:hypothetical protein